MASKKLTFRLSRKLAAWLAERVRRTGLPVGRIIQQELERVKAGENNLRFMRHAGKIAGPKDLSERQGFWRA